VRHTVVPLSSTVRRAHHKTQMCLSDDQCTDIFGIQD
jgi:hypothetical protein